MVQLDNMAKSYFDIVNHDKMALRKNSPNQKSYWYWYTSKTYNTPTSWVLSGQMQAAVPFIIIFIKLKKLLENNNLPSRSCSKVVAAAMCALTSEIRWGLSGTAMLCVLMNVLLGGLLCQVKCYLKTSNGNSIVSFFLHFQPFRKYSQPPPDNVLNFSLVQQRE